MDQFASYRISLINFNEVYDETIRPKLEAIDLFLKSNSSPYTADEVACLLEIDINILLNTMEQLEITALDKLNFFTLIFHLPHEICKLIQRQYRYILCKEYTPEMIAFIYNLNISKVKSAFDDLKVDTITSHELPDIFKRIHMTVF